MDFDQDTPFGPPSAPAPAQALPPDPHAADCWAKCLDVIRGRVNTQSYKTWFEPIQPLKLAGGRLNLQVPSQFFSEWLDEHYIPLVREAMTQVTGREMDIEYQVRTEDRDDVAAAVEVATAPPETFRSGPLDGSAGLDRPPSADRLQAFDRVQVRSGHAGPPIEPSLNRRYTFENYIKGESNQFACAAALAVANNPGGTSFNPLVIYGGVGLGKTHLVHAIGNRLLSADPRKRVLYTSSEKFTVDFVEAIQRDTVSAFSSYYRSVDLLIVDDIQFFSGKEKTQDIFFHTFNTLHQSGKQIVLSSDKAPKELKGLNERLTSRFQWGLTADVQPPDLETRIAILLKKSTSHGIELPHEIVEFIAANITSNIREMEGCLISLLARASLENKKIDLELTRNVVRSIVGEVKTHITIDEIQRTVCEHLSIAPDLLRAKTRKQEIVTARQMAMYLSKELTNSSLKTIGLHFGGRDHSTVIHAYQTIEDSMKEDAKLRTMVQQLRSKLELGRP